MANEAKNMIVNVMTADGKTIPLHMTETESNLIENDQVLLRKIITRERSSGNQDAATTSSAIESEMDDPGPALDDSIPVKSEEGHGLKKNLSLPVWTPPRVKMLIALYKENIHSFSTAYRKRDVWQVITEHLNANCGTSFGADEGDRKWRNLKSRYNLILDTLKETGYARNKMWPYFTDMEEALHLNPETQPSPAPTRIVRRPLKGEKVTAPRSPSPPSSPESTSESQKHPDAPGWFISLFYEFEEQCSRRHEEHLRELRKRRKLEKKRNKLLKQIMEKMKGQTENSTT